MAAIEVAAIKFLYYPFTGNSLEIYFTNTFLAFTM